MLAIEQKLYAMFVSDQHIALLVGIYAVIMMLREMDVVKAWLFTGWRKSLIAPLNVVLSTIGVFVLKLTSFETMGMKIVIIAVISALVTFTHEAAGKYIVDFLKSKLSRKPKVK